MKNNKMKALLLLAMMVLLLTVAVSGTIAWLADNSDPVENTFTPAEVNCQINEEWTDGGTEKKNVTVTNTGDVYANIRAAIVVTWQKGGDVYGTLPVLGTDYTMSLGSGWTKDSEGFYYYNSAVPPEDDPSTTDVYEDRTTNLINSCTVLKPAPEAGYNLHVEVLAQAIQAEGMGAKSAVDAFVKAAQ